MSNTDNEGNFITSFEELKSEINVTIIDNNYVANITVTLNLDDWLTIVINTGEFVPALS
jgi:hypothetical protein